MLTIRVEPGKNLEIPTTGYVRVIFGVNINTGEQWFLNGELHREDGPAVIYPTDREWFLHGKRHRIGGPAVISDDGLYIWYYNGQKHREDGPAIISYVSRIYRTNPEEDPNAIRRWFLNGIEYPDEKSWKAAKIKGEIL